MININDRDLCLCGTKKNYKNCCKKYKDVSLTEMLDKYSEYSKVGKYQEAFECSRGILSNYLINVKSHTAMLIESKEIRKKKLGQRLLEIDVKALSECIYRMMRFIDEPTVSFDFNFAFRRYKEWFNNFEWHNLLNYFNALLKCKNNDVYGAKKVLTDKIDINKVNSAEYLMLYYDLFSNELAFTEKMNILERIIDRAENIIEEIHYKGVLGMQYYQIKDIKKAKEIFDEITKKYIKNANVFSSSYEYYQLGNMWYFNGVVNEDEESIKNSISCYHKAIDLGDFNKSGIANMLWHIGQDYISIKEYEHALDSLNSSIELEESYIAKIDKAYIYIATDQIGMGKEILDAIDTEKLSFENLVDYILTYIDLMYSRPDKEKIDYIKEKIKSLEINDPILSNLINESLIRLLEIDLSKINNFKSSGLISKVINRLNRYILCQPNIIGIGLNLNNVIEDSCSNKNKR